MRTWIRILAGFIGMWAFALTAEQSKFAGTWEATSGGKTFLILKLQTGDRISGTMNAGAITMDENGDLLEAGPVEDKESPIFFARAEGDRLEFDFQDDDNEVMHFELKLTAGDQAELRIVDKHYPKIKPFPLKKKS